MKLKPVFFSIPAFVFAVVLLGYLFIFDFTEGTKVLILAFGFLLFSYLYMRRKRELQREEILELRKRFEDTLRMTSSEMALLSTTASNLTDIIIFFIEIPSRNEEARTKLVFSRFMAIKKLIDSYKESGLPMSIMPHRLILLIEKQTKVDFE